MGRIHSDQKRYGFGGDNFLEDNILSRFGYPRKRVTDNSQAFKSMAMISFFQKYNIVLGHSKSYYPQGNELSKSSNKILITIIKKVLNENKKAWHVHLKYALWANWIGTKKLIGMSPFQMVYRIGVVLSINLAFPVMKLWKDEKEEPNHVTRRINQLSEVQQNRAKVDEKLQKYQDNMKALFDQKTKHREFLPGDLVLKWEARKEDSGKHDKFDHIWCGTFKITASEGKNSFLLENMDGKILNAPINGHYLNNFMQ
jgi:transposase InsO family protein